MKICFATNNHHKIEEVRQVLGDHFSLTSLLEIGCTEELPETRDTLEGNALQKAEYVFNNFSISCFADDTGLEVDALNGAPGVYSARYAGDQRNSDDNMRLLLENLGDRPNRRAQFRTVIALLQHGKDPVLFEGILPGKIITEKRGQQGFGYDPLFIPDSSTKTLAEMSMEEKNQLSHRAIAVKKLVEYLKNSVS